MMTTDSVLTENIYALKREPVEAARVINTLDLTIRTKAANRHEVAGETFPTVELAGDHVRRLRHLADKLKQKQNEQFSTRQP